MPGFDRGSQVRDGLSAGGRWIRTSAPVVGDADDVAWPGLLAEVALAGEEKHRGLHRHLASSADILQFHAALETAGGDPHKGDAVAVLRIDIGLHLEHETGDPRLLGRDRPWVGELAPAPRPQPANPRAERRQPAYPRRFRGSLPSAL
jgi:hypothetical protein